jgi:hypothetical protein
MDTPSSTVGPGIGAFIAFFLLALFLWLLMRNMNGRMRRMAYREQQRVAELEARDTSAQEQREAQGQGKDQGQPTKQRRAKGQAQEPRPADGPAPAQTEPDEPAP